MIASRVIDELRKRLLAAYGDRLHAVVLFGSEARGNAWPDSDIDVLAVLETLTDDYGEAKFWLAPQVELAKQTGLADHVVGEAERLVIDDLQEIVDAWNKHFAG